MTARNRADPEPGSATVLTVGGVAAVALVLAGVLVVAGAVRDVHRARAAADLAALAAVGPLTSGGVVDCRMGASIAGANGAELTRCTTEPDGSVVVSVAVEHRWPAGWRLLPPTVTARARAGVVGTHVSSAPPKREQ